jgi:hypothetical protein
LGYWGDVFPADLRDIKVNECRDVSLLEGGGVVIGVLNLRWTLLFVDDLTVLAFDLGLPRLTRQFKQLDVMH